MKKEKYFAPLFLGIVTLAHIVTNSCYTWKRDQKVQKCGHFTGFVFGQKFIAFNGKSAGNFLA